MIEIKNKLIDVSIDDVIQRLKNDLIERGMGEYFKDIKDAGDNIMVTCPIHSNHNERRPSCGILKVSHNHRPAGTVHCFTCGYTATIQQMISDLLGFEDGGLEGEKWLINNFIDNLYEGRENLNFDLTRDVQKPPKAYITEEELEKFRYYHNYMWKRKLTREIVNLFDIGYDKDTRCITFPVNDLNGKCLFIARRSVDTKMFMLPKNIDKPVYGLDKVLKNNKSEIIVCESVFNALTCYVYGDIPGVALFGTGSSKQYDILRNINIRHYILAFDGDDAGDKGRKRFFDAMKDYAFISYYQLPRGKDLNDLTKEEFESLKEIPMNF